MAIGDVHDEVGRRQADELGDHARYLHADVSLEAEMAGANKPTHELTEAEWDRAQAVNMKGVFFGTKHAIAPLRAAGGGSIINLSSIYGLVGGPTCRRTTPPRARCG